MTAHADYSLQYQLRSSLNNLKGGEWEVSVFILIEQEACTGQATPPPTPQFKSCYSPSPSAHAPALCH
jgi:hypothetical protein